MDGNIWRLIGLKRVKALYKKHKEFIMEVIHFGMVGVINTLMGWGIMAVLYNLIHMNYWLSSGISYFIGSIFSYHANAKVTFKVEAEEKDKALPWRFAINIIICYLIAFSLAQPLVEKVLSTQTEMVNHLAQALYVEPVVIVDNVAMVLGMGFFIVMNFFGQKLFVFRKVQKTEKDAV